ncbi:MAG: protoporphyrinogen oxidase [Planctomycetota bacterium]
MSPETDPPPLEDPPSVAVVGGGITGLAAAHRLLEVRPEVRLTLFEATDRVGGVLETVEGDGFLIERSADNFLTKTPFATALCDRLGIGDTLIPTNEDRRRALIVHNGRVKRTPDGFVIAAPRKLTPVLRSDLLSVAGKLRLAFEPLVPARKSDADEPVADFVRRRLGREALERLVQPLVGGIYTADLERLSMAATLPQFREQERRHGSLWRANRQPGGDVSPSESGARYGAFVAPRRGMSQLIDALDDRLPDGSARKHVLVNTIKSTGRQWALAESHDRELGQFDGVLLATPAAASAAIVRSLDDSLADSLASIEYASSVVVCMGYRIEQLPALPEGFGFVVPEREGRRILAASFASLKFSGRAPEGELLVRVFIGGALQHELTELDDEQLVEIAATELAELLGARGEPRRLEVARWPTAMPQYHVGHLERVECIDRQVSRHRGLELAGAAYRGVGVPQCIQSGEAAADRLLATLG